MLSKDEECQENLRKYFEGDTATEEVDNLLFMKDLVTSWFDTHLQKQQTLFQSIEDQENLFQNQVIKPHMKLKQIFNEQKSKEMSNFNLKQQNTELEQQL